ncbi:MAG: tetratricopeptide repeat protein [Acidobacteria bacterium]|nr:tetratricopeptide repeat protein [Acidobacteriota bacterium]
MLTSWQGLQRSALVVFLGAVIALPSWAEGEWIKVTSSNFELYTTAGEKRGRNAVQHFETIRQFFLDITGTTEFSGQPVRIIGFRSKKEYAPYSPNEVAAAFYTPSRARDYIVMSGISSTEYPTAVHEYMHLIQRHSGKKYSLWMNEGLAQLYETLTPMGKKVRVGDVNPGRYQFLRSKSSWISLETLFSVDYESEHYNEKKRAGMFYGESWALTHMLSLSPDYRELNSLGNLIAAVVGGESEAAAFQRLYGKTLDEVYRDLRTYIREGRLFAALFDIKLQKAAEEPQVEPASELEASLVLADLLSVMRGKEEKASGMYAALVEQNPESAEAHEGLGYLAFRAKDDNLARKHLGRAVELGSKSVKTHRDYVYFLQQNGAKAAEMIAVLEKALLIELDNRDLHFSVALLYMQDHSYVQALRHMGLIRNMDEEKAFRLFDAMAFAYYEIGRFEDGRKAAEKARLYAKSPDEILRVDRMLEAFDARTAEGEPALERADLEVPVAEEDDVEQMLKLKRASQPSATETDQPAPWEQRVGPGWLRAEGTFEELECLGGTANMHVQTADKRIILAILDPGSVLVRGTKTMLDFRCGAQGSQPIAVEYEASQEAGAGAAGIVRALEYR